jgi:hypothetical protein
MIAIDTTWMAMSMRLIPGVGSDHFFIVPLAGYGRRGGTR